ncbi:MAG: non-heme iron oxygenase ferredoxin subunit [Candidatus Omnitrophica bacterium]|nr:non-heme iron oxygenase ferredoxin subunit [Candidatus Omnitrophota bacterium]
MSGFVKVAKVEELPPGQGKCLTAGAAQIALFNAGGSFYAVDNTCTHAGGPLGEGMLEGDQVECPWHGARFSVKTGEALTPPAFEKVASYKVRVNGSDIEVEL